MMNIFIMVLVSLFMAGYFWLSSPSQQISQHATEYAVTMSDLRSVAQCTVAVHNAQINGYEFQDICVEQNGIVSKFICLDISNFAKIIKIPFTDSFVDSLNLNGINFAVNLEVGSDLEFIAYAFLKTCNLS